MSEELMKKIQWAKEVGVAKIEITPDELLDLISRPTPPKAVVWPEKIATENLSETGQSLSLMWNSAIDACQKAHKEAYGD